MSALNLPEGCAHKLGMGKPLGLGSVKIESKVFLSDREGRYKLFQKEWNGLKALGDEDTQKYIKLFETFILTKLKERSLCSIWELDRMKELKRLLDFKNKPEDIKTEYLDVQVFKKRKVLPEASKI